MARDPVAHLRTGMVQVQVGSRLLPMKRSLHCKICNHPGRGEIEAMLLVSDPLTRIAAWSEHHTSFDIEGVTVEYPAITVQQLRNHISRGHIPVDTRTLMDLTAQREQELGIDLTEATGMAVDGVILAKLVVGKTVAGIQNGELRPELADGLRAAKLLQELQLAGQDDSESAERVNLQQEAMQRIFTLLRDTLDDQTWETVARKLSGDTVLAEISQRMRPTDDTKELTA